MVYYTASWLLKSPKPSWVQMVFRAKRLILNIRKQKNTQTIASTPKLPHKLLNLSRKFGFLLISSWYFEAKICKLLWNSL